MWAFGLCGVDVNGVIREGIGRGFVDVCRARHTEQWGGRKGVFIIEYHRWVPALGDVFDNRSRFDSFSCPEGPVFF